MNLTALYMTFEGWLPEWFIDTSLIKKPHLQSKFSLKNYAAYSITDKLFDDLSIAIKKIKYSKKYIFKFPLTTEE